MDYRTIPNTNLIIDYSTVGLNKAYESYFLSGFLSIQTSIDSWAWEQTVTPTLSSFSSSSSAASQCSASPPAVVGIPMPTPAYINNAFFGSVGFLLGLALTMASLYPMSRLTKSVVEEKESRMREVMKIMGLYDWANQLSWFIIAFLVFFWIAISSTFVSHATFLANTNVSILFAYFFLFALSVISVSFFLSVFFTNAKLAAILVRFIFRSFFFFAISKLLFCGIGTRFLVYYDSPSLCIYQHE